MEETDVIVVGGGPVGLAMAAELSYRGIKTILIEKKPTTSDLAKAVAINSRSMEHFRRVGLQEKLQDASFPRDMAINITFATNLYNGRIFFRRYICTSLTRHTPQMRNFAFCLIILQGVWFLGRSH